MNISLPDPLKRIVDGQIASGRYSSVSEYVHELIREDERKKAGEALEALLLQGLQGKDTPFTPDDWKAIRKRPSRASRRKRRGSDALDDARCPLRLRPRSTRSPSCY